MLVTNQFRNISTFNTQGSHMTVNQLTVSPGAGTELDSVGSKLEGTAGSHSVRKSPVNAHSHC